MGWKSTIDLTRAEALAIIGEPGWEGLKDETLAGIVEELRGGESHGHNYRIVETPSQPQATDNPMRDALLHLRERFGSWWWHKDGCVQGESRLVQEAIDDALGEGRKP